MGSTLEVVNIIDAPAIVIVLAFLHPHRVDLEWVLSEQVGRGILSSDEARGRKNIAFRAIENRPDRDEWAARMASSASMTLMMAAEGLGVDSAMIEIHDVEKVCEAFGIPDDHAVCHLIALGYSAEDRPFPGRLPVDVIAYAEHFGQPWDIRAHE